MSATASCEEPQCASSPPKNARGRTTFPPLQSALSVVGIDRLIFSVDCPYTDNASARALLDSAPISPRGDREKRAHAMVEALLGL